MVYAFLQVHRVSRRVDDIRVDGVVRTPNGASGFVPDLSPQPEHGSPDLFLEQVVWKAALHPFGKRLAFIYTKMFLVMVVLHIVIVYVPDNHF